MAKKSFVKLAWIIAAIIVCYVSVVIFPYFVATYQYEKLISLQRLSKEDVEKNLFFYSANEISIKNSLWGKKFNLKPNESCWQYVILWTEPIDIVYDEHNKVIKIFASFE